MLWGWGGVSNSLFKERGGGLVIESVLPEEACSIGRQHTEKWGGRDPHEAFPTSSLQLHMPAQAAMGQP